MKVLITLVLQFFILSSFAQNNNDSLEKLLDFVNQTRDYKEGFSESTGQNDFTYHSIRTDINDCLLTRATDGSMSIEWTTISIDEPL